MRSIVRVGSKSKRAEADEAMVVGHDGALLASEGPMTVTIATRWKQRQNAASCETMRHRATNAPKGTRTP